jgi:glycosyltransferase involved in cell wall biosynthesis
MNILLIIPSLQIGGAEVFVVRLANHLAQRGHKVWLLDVNPKDRSPLLTLRINPDVQLLLFEKELSFIEKAFWKLLYIIGQFTEAWLSRVYYHRKKYDTKKLAHVLENLVKNKQIEVINTHLASADWMVAHYIESQNKPPKYVISMHGCYNQADFTNHPVKKQIYLDRKWVLELADQVVLLTPKNAEPLEGFRLRNEPVYIPLGFDRPGTAKLNPKISQPESYITFGLVSRAVARKGWEEAVQATQLLYMEGLPCRLVLVGGGSSQVQLQQQFGLLPYIHFVGATAEVLECVKQFDVGLFPSYIETESFPNVVIEYLACGKPVIGTDIGEVKNMITTSDGNLAGQLLYYRSEGTSVTELADLMRNYIQNEELFHLHQERAYDAFKKFDMVSCVSAYENVYGS